MMSRKVEYEPADTWHLRKMLILLSSQDHETIFVTHLNPFFFKCSDFTVYYEGSSSTII